MGLSSERGQIAHRFIQICAHGIPKFTQGDREAVLRTKYALILSRWRLKEVEGLKNDVEALLIAYEDLYDTCENEDQQTHVRQQLDRAYRLWLTLVAADEDYHEELAQRFLGQLCALREGALHFAHNWAKMADMDFGTVMTS